MGKRSQRSGKNWEREAAKNLSAHGGEWKRIPGSGAFATQAGDSTLSGDLKGEYPWWNKAIRGEAKFGYGGSTQLTLKRRWVEKIREEADRCGGLPAMLLKFKGVMSGDPSAKLICFDFETWNIMMKELESLWWDYLRLLEEEYHANK